MKYELAEIEEEFGSKSESFKKTKANHHELPEDFSNDPNLSFNNVAEYDEFLAIRESSSEYGKSWRDLKGCIDKLERYAASKGELSEIELASDFNKKCIFGRYAIENIPFIYMRDDKRIRLVVLSFYLAAGGYPLQVLNQQMSILWHELNDNGVDPKPYFDATFPDFDCWSKEHAYKNLF